MSSTTYTARWIIPLVGAPLPQGTLTVRGPRIEAIDTHGIRSSDVDFGNAAIVPGFVNAHTHLDLSGARGLIAPTDAGRFTDWIRSVIAYRRGRTPEATAGDISDGLKECLRSGTTLIGDIAAGGASWDCLASASVRAVVFREVIGLTLPVAQEAYLQANAWLNSRPKSKLCRGGISPHAPYSVRKSLLSLAAHLCANARAPFAVHYAESPAEAQLREQQTGPFEALLKDLNLWEPDALCESHASFIEALDYGQPPIFVHGNYLSPTARLPRDSTIVYCPRTHAAFRHPPHPFREFLARGVRVCLGTDSLASNPDLDILAEARFLHTLYPDFPQDALLRMITLSGAEALGWADETGSLEVGKSADFVVVPLPNRDVADPYALLFAYDAPPDTRRTLFRGAWQN